MTAHDAAIGLQVRYGVPVTYLGEDGEGMLAFTADPRRALAAMAKLVREDCAEPLVEQYDMSSFAVRWVLFHDHCGCKHADAADCTPLGNGDVTCCSVEASMVNGELELEVVEHDCPHPGLPPCTTDDGFGWIVDDVPAGTPGAVQVCRVRQ